MSAPAEQKQARDEAEDDWTREYDTERDHESYSADPADLGHELSQDK
jgi:hypothetical protein